MGKYSLRTTLRSYFAIPWSNFTSRSTSNALPEFLEEHTDRTISTQSSTLASAMYWTSFANSALNESRLRLILKQLGERQRASDYLPTHTRACALTLDVLTTPVALIHTTKRLFAWRLRRCSLTLACSLWRRTVTLTLIGCAIRIDYWHVFITIRCWHTTLCIPRYRTRLRSLLLNTLSTRTTRMTRSSGGQWETSTCTGDTMSLTAASLEQSIRRHSKN